MMDDHTEADLTALSSSFNWYIDHIDSSLEHATPLSPFIVAMMNPPAATSTLDTTPTTPTTIPTLVAIPPPDTTVVPPPRLSNAGSNGARKPSSCHICAGHKVRCDGGRPCSRCTRLNRADQCHDKIVGAPKVSTRRRRVQPSTPVPTGLTLGHVAVFTAPVGSASSSPPQVPLVTSSDHHDYTNSSLVNTTNNSATVQASISSPTPTIASSLSSSSSSSTDDVDATPITPHHQPLAKHYRTNTPSPDPLSFSSSSTRSASRSPARKKERYNHDHTDATDLVPYSSSSSSSSSFPSSYIPIVSGPRHIHMFDETIVIRKALVRLVPWLRRHCADNYAPDSVGKKWLLRMDAILPHRVCPWCASPSKRCVSCSAPPSATAPLTFIDFFCDSFFNSMWLPKLISLVDAPLLNTLPAGFCWTLEPALYGSNPPALTAHHHAMMNSMALFQHMSAIAAARASMQADTAAASTDGYDRTTDGTGPMATSWIDFAADTPGGQRHAPIPESVWNSAVPLLNSVGVPIVPQTVLSSSSSSTTIQSASSLPTLSQSVHVDGKGSLPTDLLPPTGSYESVCPGFAFSMNEELTRLTGFTTEEMKARIQTVGWKMNICFAHPDEAAALVQNTFLCIVGLQESWTFTGHIVTKWHGVVKCQIYGTMKKVNGYRTTCGFFIPLPPSERLSDDPRDPIFS